MLRMKCRKCGNDFPVSEALYCETCESRIICPTCGTCNCIACEVEDEHRCNCVEERLVLSTVERGTIEESP